MGKLYLLLMLFKRNYQRYIVNMITKKVHRGQKRGIIDFESLTEAHWGVNKMNPIRDYMSEVIISMKKRTP